MIYGAYKIHIQNALQIFFKNGQYSVYSLARDTPSVSTEHKGVLLWIVIYGMIVYLMYTDDQCLWLEKTVFCLSVTIGIGGMLFFMIAQYSLFCIGLAYCSVSKRRKDEQESSQKQNLLPRYHGISRDERLNHDKKNILILFWWLTWWPFYYDRSNFSIPSCFW